MLASSLQRAIALALACALLAAPASAQRKNEPTLDAPQPIQEPHYGDTVFHFYQSKYFSAITGLMVSQHFDRLAPHADEAEVLRGGLLLSYGLHRDAGAIFAKLIEQGANPSVRDRAWFYLAKIRFQRGLPDDAQAALSRVEGTLPGELQVERVLLQAQLMMARQDHAGAADVLRGLTQSATAQSGEASRYAQFNLGVALIKGGDAQAGRTLLDQLGSSPAADEEQRSLRDKANVALGYAALQDNRPTDARTALQRVRLTSLHANKALLGFGWAAASMKDPQAALVPWTELAERDANDAAALEARIAVPYAYAELGAYGQALQRYEGAIAAFERERTALDESIAAVRSGKLLQSVDKSNLGVEMGWFWQLRDVPELPHPAHLASMMAEHDFQEAFKSYRDLLFLGRNLADWAQKLGTFDDMVGVRRQAFAERLPRVRLQAGTLNVEALATRNAALLDELARVETQNDVGALASEHERALLARVQQAQRTVAVLGSTPEASAATERLRLAAGVLTWQMAQPFAGRVWNTRKSLREAHDQLVQARARDTALASAQRDEPARIEGFARRVRTLDERLKTMIPQVAALTLEQQQATQGLAVVALQRQQERLATYVRQARYAIAQLYDHASVAKKDDRVGKN